MHNTIVRILQKLTTNLEMISLCSFQPKVNSFENFRFLYISLNGIQCLTKWIMHFKNNYDFLIDNFWKDLTIVTTLFFLLSFEFDSKVNNTKTKKGGNLQICNKKMWKTWASSAFEPGTSCKLGESATHYSTEDFYSRSWFVRFILFITSILTEKLFIWLLK